MKLNTDQIIDNRYKIVEHLGQGGMGVVWKAIDTKLGDDVVLKMPLNHVDSDILKRFEREARSMRRHSIDCPHILNIEDIGNLDETPWYIMRYLGGGSIIDRALSKTEDGSITWDDQTFVWLEKIAGALDYLHQKDCFHRDVKPENILFGGEGTPYLVDFGIVKTVSEATSMVTEQGKLVGTMAYMAPEILDGGKFTDRSDQYSLAVTLYEFLTGERPFGGTTFFALFRSIQDGHRKLNNLHPVIPLPASLVVDRALASDAKQRYSSCSEFAREFLAGLKSEQHAQVVTSLDDQEEMARQSKVEVPQTIQRENSTKQSDISPLVAKTTQPKSENTSDTNLFGNVAPSSIPTNAGIKSVGRDKGMLRVAIATVVLALVAGFGFVFATNMFADPDLPIASNISENSIVDSQNTKAVITESSQPSDDSRVDIGKLKDVALGGDLQSQKRLAEIYSQGDGVEQDFEKAFDWLRLAAEQNDAHSQLLVGLSYAKGDIGVKKDSKEAVRWLRKSASQDFAEAQAALGAHYLRGEGVAKDLNKAKSYLTKAIANDLPQAQSLLDLVEAELEAAPPNAEKLERAAAGGDVEAQFELAKAYDQGQLSLSKNSIVALRYYLKAAESGHLQSQLIVAKRYEKGGNRVDRSYDDAQKWYKRAARQGDSGAEQRLAELKAGGGETGFLARQGDARAQVALAKMFQDGDGVKQDIQEALKWYTKSAEQGNTQAQMNLGVLYQDGDLGKRNYSKAVHWYTKAAEKGEEFAQFNLGRIFQAGVSGVIKQSDKQAIRWFRLAAEQGNEEAQEELKSLRPSTTTNSIGMRLVRIDDGDFYMGSKTSEKERGKDELRHRVSIKRDLYVANHEVTIAQFRQFVNETGHVTTAEKMGGGALSIDPLSGEMERDVKYNWRSPGYAISDDLPVSQVSWRDVNSFAAWLGKKEGKKYRLPTEAEWEYAARAGTNTRYFSGDSYASLRGFANVLDQSRSSFYSDPGDRTDLASFNDGHPYPSPVGSYRPNKFGLYDMHGNVWEWCYDTYDPNFYQTSKKLNPYSKDGGKRRVMRGGCFM